MLRSFALLLDIENLGIIKEASLEINPFTVFIGENNTNKSWTAYSIYGLFHRDLPKDLTRDYLGLEEREVIPKDSEFRQFILETINRLVTNSSGIIEIEQLSKTYGNLVSSFLHDVSTFFSNSFISKLFKLDYEEFFKNTRIHVGINKNFLKAISRQLKNAAIEISIKTKTDRDIVKLYKAKNEDTLIIEGYIDEEIPLKHFKRMLSDLLVEFFYSAIFHNRCIFPSERKALATLEEHISGEISGLIKDVDRIPYEFFLNLYVKKSLSFPKLLEDFILLVNRLGSYSGQASKNRRVYKVLLTKFEEVLGGKVLYDKSERKYIVFIPHEKNQEIPVYSTSSMVKSLSTLYLFFEKLSSGRDLLVIDEPEMNLHPKAQVQFIELLTAFLGSSSRNFVLITTHTPYILDHLENLIDAFRYKKKLRSKFSSQKEEYKKRLLKIKNQFFLKTDQSFISPSKVNAYYFSPDGKVENIFDREIGRFYKSSFAQIGGNIIKLEGDIKKEIARLVMEN